MSRISRWVLSHKLPVAAFWLIMTLVGFAFVQTATNSLSQQFSLPGQKGYEANLAILKLYGNGATEPPLVPVVTLPHGATVDTPRVRAELTAAFDAVAHSLPFVRSVSFASTGNRLFVSNDGRTTYGLIFIPPTRGFSAPPGMAAVQSLFARLTVDGAHFRVTGFDPLQSGGNGGGGPGVLAEALIGGFGALIVLALVFRSFMALIPLLMAVVTIPVTFLAVWALTSVTQVSFIVEFLIALIGLGVAIDYSLLIVMRWREEREAGLDNREAVQRAMETAGVAVVFSGTTVAVGLLALIAIPVPFLQSVGYGGMLIPLVSVVVATTLLPAVLGSVGPRMDWPKVTHEARSGRLWMAWARLVVRRRWVAALIALVILAALLIPLTSLNIGNPSADSLSKSGPAYQGLRMLERSGISAGPLTPMEILTRAGSGPSVAAHLASIPGLRGVVAPGGRSWLRHGTQLVEAVPASDGNTSAALNALKKVRSETATLPGKVQVGGGAAQGVDFNQAVYGKFPLMIALIAIVTLVLLARAFRSVLLPLKAVMLNVISVGAAWGVMTLVWQEGYGSKLIWGIPATGSIESWIPLMVFAFLFGLSMDYEVFILARTREEFDRLHSTDLAIISGVGRTGRLVTSAALILFLAFVSLGTAPLTIIKILATGLAIGILLDATVIRSLLVPALVSLFGRWNWWLPAAPARVLRVKPSSATAPAREVA